MRDHEEYSDWKLDLIFVLISTILLIIGFLTLMKFTKKKELPRSLKEQLYGKSRLPVPEGGYLSLIKEKKEEDYTEHYYLNPPRESDEARGINPFFLPKRIDIRHVQGNRGGVGFGTNYTTVAMLFTAKYSPGYVMPILDARAHRFDNNSYAANLGFGGRYIPKNRSACRILGFNFFYDWRQSIRRRHNFQQIGAGVEVLGKRWDLRANAYFPVGNRKRTLVCRFDDFEGGFFIEKKKCEAISYAFNAEIGWLAAGKNNFLLYFAGGPYYLSKACHGSTLGGYARVRPQYKDYIAVDFSVSHDNVYKTIYQGEIIVSIPLYQMFTKKGKKPPCGLTERQIYQPIERFEIMPIGKRTCWKFNFDD